MGTKTIRGADAVSKAFEDALAHLLVDEGEPFRSITATQLSHEAGLTRQTFYRHFTSTEDVVDALAARHSAALLSEMDAASAEERTSETSLFILVFKFIEGRRDLLRALKRSGELSRFLVKFWETGGTSWAVASDEHMDPDKYLLFIHFSTSGISVLIEEWVDMEPMPSPEDMLELAGELAGELGHVLNVIASDSGEDAADVSGAADEGSGVGAAGSAGTDNAADVDDAADTDSAGGAARATNAADAANGYGGADTDSAADTSDVADTGSAASTGGAADRADTETKQ